MMQIALECNLLIFYEYLNCERTYERHVLQITSVFFTHKVKNKVVNLKVVNSSINLFSH